MDLGVYFNTPSSNFLLPGGLTDGLSILKHHMDLGRTTASTLVAGVICLFEIRKKPPSSNCNLSAGAWMVFGCRAPPARLHRRPYYQLSSPPDRITSSLPHEPNEWPNEWPNEERGDPLL